MFIFKANEYQSEKSPIFDSQKNTKTTRKLHIMSQLYGAKVCQLFCNTRYYYFHIKNTSDKTFRNKNVYWWGLCIFLDKYIPENFCSKVENLHSADDGKSSKKSHGASNCRQHVHKFCCSVLGDSVKCGGVKIDPHKPQAVFPFMILEKRVVTKNQSHSQLE